MNNFSSFQSQLFRGGTNKNSLAYLNKFSTGLVIDPSGTDYTQLLDDNSSPVQNAYLINASSTDTHLDVKITDQYAVNQNISVNDFLPSNQSSVTLYTKYKYHNSATTQSVFSHLFNGLFYDIDFSGTSVDGSYHLVYPGNTFDIRFLAAGSSVISYAISGMSEGVVTPESGFLSQVYEKKTVTLGNDASSGIITIDVGGVSNAAVAYVPYVHVVRKGQPNIGEYVLTIDNQLQKSVSKEIGYHYFDVTDLSGEANSEYIAFSTVSSDAGYGNYSVNVDTSAGNYVRIMVNENTPDLYYTSPSFPGGTFFGADSFDAFYKVKVVTNILGQFVYTFDLSGDDVYYNQPDLSFVSGKKYKFDVSDPSNDGYTLSFATTVDGIADETYVTRISSEDVIYLDLYPYAGTDPYVYFEGSNAGMGYTEEVVERSAVAVTAKGNAHIDTSVSKIGSVLSLDGTGDYLEIDSTYNSYFSFNDFTLECWVNAELYETRTSMISNRPDGIFFGIWNSELACLYYDDTLISYPYTPVTYTWTHYAVTRFGSEMRLFVNGVLVASELNARSDTLNMTSNMSDNTHIGSNKGYQYYIKGYMDEVRISNIARYTSSFTPATTAFTNDNNTLLLLHMSGTDGSTTILDDASGSINYIVTVTDSNPAVFAISGIPQMKIDFSANQSYVFDQSETSNAGQQIVFGYDLDVTGNILSVADGVTVMGTPGRPGAYTQIDLSAGFSRRLYYYSYATAGMGMILTSDINYQFGVKTNILGESVLAVYDATTWYNQSYLLFTAPYVYEFDVADSTNSGKILGFSTNVDAADNTIESIYVTRDKNPGETDAKVFLDLKYYTGDVLVYFETATTGMGYKSTGTLNTIFNNITQPSFYWDFRTNTPENDGTSDYVVDAINESNQNLKAVAQGDLTFIDVSGPLFDATSSIKIDQFTFGGICSVEVYYYTITNDNGFQRVIDFGQGDSSDNYIITTHLGNKAYDISFGVSIRDGSDGRSAKGEATQLNTWTHAIVTVDGEDDGNVEAYLNKNDQGFNQTVTVPNKSRSSNLVGKDNWGNNQFMDGYISYVRIWQDYVLTSNEITSLYNTRNLSFVASYAVKIVNNVFHLNDNAQMKIDFSANQSYVFDQSDSTNAGEQIVFGYDLDVTGSSILSVADGVTVMGTPGRPGAYTQLNLSAAFSQRLYYYSYGTSGMGMILTSDVAYQVRVETNVVGKSVWSIYNSDELQWYKQPVLSFSAPNVYEFNVEDSTNSGYQFSFGTSEDVVDNTVENVNVIREGTAGDSGAKVILDLMYYTGSALGYYDNSVTGMGYVEESQTATVYAVTVSGSPPVFHIDNNAQTRIDFVANTTYVFDQSDSSNDGYQLVLGYELDNSSTILTVTDDVTVTGSPGRPGAYTQIVLPSDFGQRMYYYSYETTGMGMVLTPDVTHQFRVETNVAGDSVWSVYDGSDAVWYNQPDMSFSAPNVYEFVVSDSTNASYVLSFGTTNDVYDDTIESTYVTREGNPGATDARVILDLRYYTGDALVYFEDSSEGMGYTVANAYLEANTIRLESNGDFSISADRDLSYCVVGGGGCGGIGYIGSGVNARGGNGGNGGVVANGKFSFVKNTAYTATIGSGGSYQSNSNGGSSSFIGVSVEGGYKGNNGGDNFTSFNTRQTNSSLGARAMHDRSAPSTQLTYTGEDGTGYNNYGAGGGAGASADTAGTPYRVPAGYYGGGQGGYLTSDTNRKGITATAYTGSGGGGSAADGDFNEDPHDPGSGASGCVVIINIIGSYTYTGNFSVLETQNIPVETFVVTVSGNPEAFYLDNIEKPNIEFAAGLTYLFDQSDSSNSGEQIVFGYDHDNSFNILTSADGVTIVGTPGQPGAYTQLELPNDFVGPLYYYSYASAGMGMKIISDITYSFSVKNNIFGNPVWAIYENGTWYNQPDMSFSAPTVYEFNVSDSGNANYLLKFDTVVDVVDNDDDIETNYVTRTGTPGVDSDANIILNLSSYPAGSGALVYFEGTPTVGMGYIEESQSVTPYVVTVNGSPSVFYIDDNPQTRIDFAASTTYVFDQSDSTNAGHQIIFGYTLDDSGSMLTDLNGVTVMGTPGKPGAYTQIDLPADFSQRLYYYSYSTTGMGMILTSDIVYQYRVETNIVDESVWSVYNGSDWYNQPDLSFSAPNVYEFDVADSTNADYVLSFGTTVDSSDTIIDTPYVNREGPPGSTGARIILDLEYYTGDALVYFENTSTGMGYYRSVYQDNLVDIWTTIGLSTDSGDYTEYNYEISADLSGREDSIVHSTNTNDLYNGTYVFTSDENGANANRRPRNITSNNIDGIWVTFSKFCQMDFPFYIQLNSSQIDYVNNNNYLSSYYLYGIDTYGVKHLLLTRDPFENVDGNFIEDPANTISNTTYFKTIRYETQEEEDATRISYWYLNGAISNIPAEHIYTSVVESSVFVLSSTSQLRIDFSANQIYVFDQSHVSNAGEQIVFGYNHDDTANILKHADGVTVVGTPGQPGAYTLLDLPDGFVGRLYYYSQNTSDMGMKIIADISYQFRVETNVVGDSVWSVYDVSDAVWYNQPDMSFSAPTVYEFVVSDSTNANYVLTFGTAVDDYGSVIESSTYVTREGNPGTTDARVILDLRYYTGDTLVYFEDSSAGMGYSQYETEVESTETNANQVLASKNGTLNSVTKSTLTVTGNTDEYKNGDYIIEVSTQQEQNNNLIYKLVNGVGNSGYAWHTDSVKYDGGSGNFNSINSTYNVGGYYGEWAKFTMPYAMRLTEIYIENRGTTYRNPKSVQVLGSNDGTTFHHIDGISVNNTKTPTTFVSSNTAYSTLCIVIESIHDNSNFNDQKVNMDQLQFIGYPQIIAYLDVYTVTVENFVFDLSGTAKPKVDFVATARYIFDQSHHTNAGQQIVFGYDPDDKDHILTSADGVTVMGTPGQPGAYTQLDLSDGFVGPLYYYSDASADMGYSLAPDYIYTFSVQNNIFGNPVWAMYDSGSWYNQPELSFTSPYIYEFGVSDSTNANYELKFGTTLELSDTTVESDYVIREGTRGTTNSRVILDLREYTGSTLFYFENSTTGMGYSGESQSATSYAVTVSGDPSVFYIDDVAQAKIDFAASTVYVFDQSHSTNAGHQIVFGFAIDNTGSILGVADGVTVMGTPGQPGAYTQIDLSSGFSQRLYYYSHTTTDMGMILSADVNYQFGVQTNVIDESVFAMYDSDAAAWYNQPDLSFSAPNVYEFAVSDSTNTNFELTFGTAVDDYDAAIENTYVVREGTPGNTGAKVILDLRYYTGDSLVYFEGSSAGMGYNVYSTESLWVQKGSDLDGEASGDQFGKHVSLSSDGNVVAVGGLTNDGNGSNSGHARVFAWNGSTWIQRGGDIDGEAAGDQLSAVSLSSDGTILAVGANSNDGGGGNGGHVRVYNWNGSVWSQLGADIDEVVSSNSGFSTSLSSDGTILAIGAIRYDAVGYSDSGSVRIVQWNGSSWVQRGSYITDNQTSAYGGYTVSLSSDGNVVACGSQRYDTANGADSGRVRVFEWGGSDWTQRGGDLDGDNAGDFYGSSVSLSSNGNILSIGGTHNDTGANDGGHSRVFEWDGINWTQLGSDFFGTTSFGYNGFSTSLSSDGTIVAIGTQRSEGVAGEVSVYKWDGITWNQIGDMIIGESGGDHSASFISLSSNGSTLAIGAIQNDGTTGVSNDNRGHVRVYNGIFSNITTVTVSGDLSVFYLSGVPQQEFAFAANTSYIFDQSDSTNVGQQIVFGYTIDDSDILTATDGVTVMGTPGQPGAYTQLELPSDFTGTLYYYSYTTPYMGYGPLTLSVDSNSKIQGETLTVTIINRTGTSKNYTIFGVVSSDINDESLTGTVATGQELILTYNITGQGKTMEFNIDSLSETIVLVTTISYVMSVVSNVAGQTVYSFYDGSAWNNQMDLTFTSPNVYSFDIGDGSLSAYDLMFGTINDDYTTEVSSTYITSTGTIGNSGAKIILDLRTYSGNSLYYFDRNTSNMGYYAYNSTIETMASNILAFDALKGIDSGWTEEVTDTKFSYTVTGNDNDYFNGKYTITASTQQSYARGSPAPDGLFSLINSRFASTETVNKGTGGPPNSNTNSYSWWSNGGYSSGVPTGDTSTTLTSGTDVVGEWIQIEIPFVFYADNLRTIGYNDDSDKFFNSGANNHNSIQFLGSNDGENFTSLSKGEFTPDTIDYNVETSVRPYANFKILRIVALRIGGGDHIRMGHLNFGGDVKNLISINTYTVVVNSGAFELDGDSKPEIIFTPYVRYVFDQSDPSNIGEQIVFGYSRDYSSKLTSADGVTVVGTPGQSGAYTQLELPFDFTGTLYYYSNTTENMGF